MITHPEQMPSEVTSRLLAIAEPARGLEQSAASLHDALKREAAITTALLRRARQRKATSLPPSARRVLVVDDDEQQVKLYRRILLEVVEFVDVAGSVASAIRRAKETAYDLLVLDYRLTNGTAADIIREVRRRSQNRLTYTLLISAFVTGSDGKHLARAIGADAWLAKGFSPESLQDAAHKAFALDERVRKDR